MHIQVFGDSQFQYASFLLGRLLKNMLAGRKSYFDPLFEILDFIEHRYKFTGNLSSITRVFYSGFCWNMLTYRKFYFGHVLGILDCIYSIPANLSFRMNLCYWGRCWDMRACVWDSGFQRTHIPILGESQFSNAAFLLGLLLKYAGWQKIIFRASVWILDWFAANAYTNFRCISVFRMHLFYLASCRNMIAHRKSYFEPLFGILDCSECIYKFSVNLSFVMHLFYSGFCQHMTAYRKSHFEFLFGVLDCSERAY